MKKDPDYVGKIPIKPRPPRQPQPTTPPDKSEPATPATPPEYEAKTAEVKEIPEETTTPDTPEPVKVPSITLTVSPDESSIYLNGKFWGISPKGGKIENLRLPPGKYLLEVVKPGYKTYKNELEVGNQKITMMIILAKE